MATKEVQFLAATVFPTKARGECYQIQRSISEPDYRRAVPNCQSGRYLGSNAHRYRRYLANIKVLNTGTQNFTFTDAQGKFRLTGIYIHLVIKTNEAVLASTEFVYIQDTISSRRQKAKPAARDLSDLLSSHARISRLGKSYKTPHTFILIKILRSLLIRQVPKSRPFLPWK